MDADLAIKSSFSALPPPATPTLPITLPLNQIGTPPLNNNNSGSEFKFFVSTLASAFLNNKRVGVFVDKAV